MRLLFASGVCLAVASAAHAGTAFINSALLSPTADSAGSTVLGAKVRIATNNWDQSLSPTSGTATPGNFLAKEVSNSANLLNLSFSLTHAVGVGFTWTLTDSTNSWVLSWLDGDVLGGHLNNRPFNALRIANEAREGQSVRSELTNLAFVSSLTQVGSFQDRIATPTTANNGIGLSPGFGTSTQWLIADTNLASIDWTLSGNILLERTPNQNPQDRLRLDIHGRLLEGTDLTGSAVQPVPEPFTMALIGAGLAAGYRRVRRRPKR